MKLDTKTATSYLTDKIRDLIVEGRLEPGAALRQEELSERFGVSRTPMRHALKALSSEGFVQYDDFRGARVSTVSPTDVKDLFEMRLAIEPIALASAFPALTKLDFARAEMALEAEAGASSPIACASLNWDFHNALYAPSRREMLLNIIAGLNRSGTRAEIVAMSIMERPGKSAEEHAALLDACRSGAAEKALDILRVHLLCACNDTLAVLENNSPN